MPTSSKEYADIIFDSIADGVFTVDRNWRITSFNRAAESITGVPREEALGKPCWEVFRTNVCETACVLGHTMKTGKSIVNQPVNILRSDGRRIPISVSSALLKDKKGNVIGGVETFRDLSIVEELRKKLRERHSFQDIISRNHKMQKIFEILPQVAESESNVLIEGAPGTGKELVARAIHELSPRKGKPFITVNSGALPDTLLESELFGYKKGAFTGAGKDKPGRFALAEKGTLFLDEIGDVSPALQVRLLRVLQEKTYEPLGGIETVKADVRIITATNHELTKEISEGRFREDLYYRINVVKLFLPPLRERKEDIPLLVEHFIKQFNAVKAREISGTDDKAMGVFMRYEWPGNIRELENTIEHAFILCSEGLIGLEHLPDRFQAMAERQKPPAQGLTLKQIEANAVYNALERNNWKRTAAARELGIDKNTLRRKIKRLELEVPDSPYQRNR